MKKIRVMVVEDSPTVKELLVHLINLDPRLEVVAAVDSGEKALDILDKVRPDVISMDIRLPGMTGFEATQKIMYHRPTPIVVVSASIESEDLNISMNALKAGALSVVEKPVSVSRSAYHRQAEKICTQLVIMSEVKVVSQRRVRDPMHFKKSAGAVEKQLKIVRSNAFHWLGIVASTGGPNALSVILGSLPEHFPLPVFVVQHITAGFHDGFISWLDTQTPLTVKKVDTSLAARPGVVYLAPADHHLVVKEHRVMPFQGPSVCRQRPSGTVLFESMAAAFKGTSIGVILTGMGEDGARGLKAVRQAGGYTIAEDASTSVVYGMPAAAKGMGAVCEDLPLDSIAPRILSLTTGIPKGP